MGMVYEKVYRTVCHGCGFKHEHTVVNPAAEIHNLAAVLHDFEERHGPEHRMDWRVEIEREGWQGRDS